MKGDRPGWGPDDGDEPQDEIEPSEHEAYLGSVLAVQVAEAQARRDE